MQQSVKKIKNEKIHPLNENATLHANSSPSIIHALDKIYLDAIDYYLTREKDTIFYEQVKPAYYWKVIMGKWPLIRSENDNFTIPLFSWAYCVTVYVMFLTLSIIAIKDLLEQIKTNDGSQMSGHKSRYDNTLTVLALVVGLQWNVGTPIFDWIFIHKNIKFLNKWKHFQESFHIKTGNKLKLKYNNRVKVSVITSILMNVLIMTYGIKHFVINVKWQSRLMISIGTIDRGMFTIFWWYSCLIISETGGKINMALIQDLKNLKGINSKKIQNYRVLWIELSNICYKLCLLFEYKVLVYIIVFITSLVASLYQTLIRVREPDDSSISPYILVFLYGLSVLFMLCEGGYRIYRKVGEQFTERIYFDCNFLQLSIKERFEIESLLNLIQNKPPLIIISDFVTLNRKLLFQILSTVMTSVVVLVQMKSRA